MRFRIFRILLTAAAIATAGLTVTAADMEIDILQYKLGRLYFGAGPEQNVFTGCPFVLFHGQDTVYAGVIEYSYPGVSISRPTFGFTDTLALDQHRAIIMTAVADSVSPVTVGCYGVHPFELVRSHAGVDSQQTVETGVEVDTTENGNPVIFSCNEPYTLAWDYESGQYDGFFSASMFPESMRINAHMTSSEAPFIAVLVPNLSVEANKDGFITTSLYYRYSVDHLWPTFFQSEVPQTINRLYLTDGAGSRSFPYDADKGQQLMSKGKNHPTKLKIGVLNPRLESLAEYFADILARQRIRVEVKKYDIEADLLLTFVMVDWEDPTASLQDVYSMLAAGDPKDKSVKETLAIVGNYIQSARQADDVSTLFHYCRLADRTMQHELGVFPLYRPTIYFLAGKHLKNARFDRSGYLDLDALTRIMLPVPQWEAEP